MSFSYTEITSRKNEKIINAAKLCEKKHRDREGLFCIEGIKLLDEIILSCHDISKIFFTAKALELYKASLINANADEYFLVSDEVYEKLSQESSPQGIFACVKMKEAYAFSGTSLREGGFVILEDIQNPLNLGAIFRCAYSLGANKIALSKSCADIYNPKTLRAGMGSIFKCEFYTYGDIGAFIEQLKDAGTRVFCTHLHSDSKTLGSFDFEKSDSIVIGNEGHGVSQSTLNRCHGSVIIPMAQNAESLNAATAASIIIWEMNKAKLLK